MRMLSFLTVLTLTACGGCKTTPPTDVAVLHSTKDVQTPTRLRVFPFDPPRRPRWVVAIDGQTVKIFDADLTLLRTLRGLTRPIDVDIDAEGLAIVLDPAANAANAANAVFRFDASGNPDPTFGMNGRLTDTSGALSRAVGLHSIGSIYLPVNLADGSSYAIGPGADGGITLGELTSYADDQVKAGCGFKPPFTSPDSKVEDGKICFRKTTFSRGGVTFVDFAEGPFIVGDFWALDSMGKLHLFRTGDFEATYALEYEITAIASGGDGRVYTAGKGVLEQRDLPRLRDSANE